VAPTQLEITGQAPAVEVVQEVLGVGHGGPQLGKPGMQL